MFHCLFLLLFLTSWPLFATQRIELVTNGICDPAHYRAITSDLDLDIVECFLQNFSGIPKKKTLLGKLWTKLPFSFPVDKKIEKFIFMNIPHLANQNLNLQKLPKEKMVLFMWEPPIRLRKMYNPTIQKCFSKIYTWNDDLVDNKTYFKFYYPCKQPMVQERPSFEEKQFCTMVVGATSDKSRSYPNELYSERIKAIRFFEKVGEEGFAFYGRNWDPASYPSYRGEVTDKIATNKQYKFTICYENCRDLPGYITEKIFDCFAAGSVPVYWGASNITSYIPKDCFIDRRDFDTLEALYTFLKGMTKEEYEGYIQRIQAYLDSPESELFSPQNYIQIFRSACKDG